METHRQILNTFIRQNQLTNTQQDLKMYCSNQAKFKLSYRGPHLWNKFIGPHNYLLEAVTINIFKIQLKRLSFYPLIY